MNKYKIPLFICLLLSLVFQSAAWAGKGDKAYKKLIKKVQHHENVVEFAEAEIYLEQNYTDGDSEVVLLAKGGDIGIRDFWVFSPQNKLIYQFHSPDKRNNLGGREILVESPEPADLNLVLNAYPEGEYTYIANAFDDQWLFSVVELDHDIPPPVSIITPGEDADVSRNSFVVMWTAASSADGFLVELSNEESEDELLVQVPGDQYSFHAPKEWMVSGTEYQVSVSIVDANGNITSVEQSNFTID